MYCKYCGKELNDDAEVCVYCGRSTGRQNVQKSYEVGESKKGIGVLLGLFLGLIGLIIGLCLYPANTEERSTFLKGWVLAFVIEIIAIIFLYVFVIGATVSMYR